MVADDEGRQTAAAIDGADSVVSDAVAWALPGGGANGAGTAPRNDSYCPTDDVDHENRGFGGG